ncbi:helix-turn-helix domain-containing protein, partial [Clostridium sp. CF012]|uniref:helix-turn-helix domain-containing protein n=1 Tax=Clostridium sp. CF012 TaxID=2843319 RepID=UPI0035C9790B|nr:DNA-binding response regulator [Clostridium sp. CF012]
EQFKIEIKDGDAKKKNRSGYKYKGYNYKNTTLIGLLNIIEDEMRVLKTIINTKEIKRRDNEQNKKKQKEKRRDENGLTKREKTKLEKIESIKKLKEKGMTYTQIAQELKFSINTIKKYSSKYIN